MIGFLTFAMNLGHFRWNTNDFQLNGPQPQYFKEMFNIWLLWFPVAHFNTIFNRFDDNRKIWEYSLKNSCKMTKIMNTIHLHHSIDFVQRNRVSPSWFFLRAQCALFAQLDLSNKNEWKAIKEFTFFCMCVSLWNRKRLCAKWKGLFVTQISFVQFYDRNILK